jgi:hypothetical protein
MNVRIVALLIDLLIPRAVVHVLVGGIRVHGTRGFLAWIRDDAAVVTVVVHGMLRLFLAVFSCAKEKKTAVEFKPD